MKRNQFFSCKGIQMMLLAVLMLLPSEVYSRIDEDNGLRLETKNNKVTVLGFAEGYENTTILDIPKTYKGNPITAIAPSAFSNNQTLEQVIFQPGTNLTIEGFAFYRCYNLSAVAFSDRVDEIGSGAFEDCISLSELFGYESVESIGQEAFKNCKKLESFTIYNNLTSISAGAFKDSGLTNLTVSRWNPELGAATDSWEDIFVNGYSIGLWNHRTIGYEVFANTKLTSIPSGMKVFTPYMFSGCSEFKNVTIPDAVTEIPPFCFAGSGINKLNLNKTRKIWKNAFTSNIGDVTIDGTIEEVQEDAFNFIQNLTINNAGIAGTHTQAGYGIASYLAAHFGTVRNLTFGNNIVNIGANWARNSFIFSVSFSKYATIGDGAFYNCPFLTATELTLAGGTIGSEAFNGSKITSINLTANTLKDGALDGINVSSLTMDNCQFGSEAFLHAKLTGFVSVDNCDIPANAFAKQNITGLTIGANVKSIGEDAFMGCSSLADVDFKTGASTITINSGAFANCPELLDMKLGENVIVKKDAFKGSFLVSDYNSAYGASDLTINKLSNIESGALNGAKFRRINVLDVNPTGDALNNTMAQQINFENATKLAGTAMLEGSTVEILYAPKLQDITQDAIGDAPNFRDFGTIKNEYLSTSAFDFGCVYSADRKTLVFVAPGRNEALLAETVEKIDLRGTDVMAAGDRTKRGIPIIDARAITNHKVTPINDESRYSCAKCIRVATGCRKYFTDFENLKGFYKPTLVQDYIQGDVNDDGKVSVADVMNVYDQLK